jgi:hemoglobin-like flavoprotein
MDAGLILDTLERAGERCADPAPLVYRRLFQLRPEFEALFVMDSDGGVRGSMLTTCFNAILGLVEDSPTQRVIISSSRFAHDGYGVAAADFDLMFVAIRDTFRDLLGADWTRDTEAAWNILLTEIAIIGASPE